MQVTETKSEGLSREFSISLPASEIEEKISRRLKEISQTAQLPGFAQAKCLYLCCVSAMAHQLWEKSLRRPLAILLSKL